MMNLWKVFKETDQEYIDLMNNGIITYNKNYQSFFEENDKDLKLVYKWLKKQYKVPSKYEFPWHLYYQVEGSTNPLDNKLFGVNSPGDYIIIVFDIPEELVKLYDDDLFIICLNYGYLSLTEQEDKEFDNYCKFLPKLGIDLYKVFNKDYFYELNTQQQNLAKVYLQKIYWSWKRIFNIYLPANEWTVCKEKTIFGMVWELTITNIKDIINFSVSEKEYNNYYNW